MTTFHSLPAEIQVDAAVDRSDLLAASVIESLTAAPGPVGAFAIDPEHADTETLNRVLGLDPARSANCVVVAGSRGGVESIAACVVLATTRADVNKRVKKLLDVRKASFLAMDRATAESGMEYGGITPLGLPTGWQVFVDARVPDAGEVIIGSGIRGSKLVLDGATLAAFPGVEVIEDLAVEVPAA